MNQPAAFSISEDDALEVAMKSMGDVTFLWTNDEAEQLLRENEKDANATYYPKGELVWSRKDAEAEFTPAILPCAGSLIFI
jgi:hypothetical protein